MTNDFELSVEILEAVNIEYHYSDEETAPDGLTLDEEIEWLFSDVDMEPAGATREERKAAREDKRKQRNDPVLNEFMNYRPERDDLFSFDIEEMDKAINSPSRTAPPFTSFEEFNAWIDEPFTSDIDSADACMHELLDYITDIPRGDYIRYDPTAPKHKQKL